ncbi:sulfatase-like hydrolase/transferase [Leptospira yasudae]|uniref:sulfatase-like hydrolase/transferase n=1 Tax=Leptospira yasudae TaxID=2202201 RepID=UPI001090FF68|nr:sulfatase-like hydrolase/transferase [Leptospira yasudae]TGM97011.1 sulfatase [Leptospira yasudae]
MFRRFGFILEQKPIRVYVRFFIVGTGISFATLLMNTSFQFMGVDLSEFKSLFVSFLPLFLKDYILTFLSSGIVFGALGLLLSSPWFAEKGKNGVDGGKPENSGVKEVWIFGVFVFLLWCHSIIFYPQLYGEFFFYRFSFLRFFLFFLTDWVPPIVPQAAALLILLACTVKYSISLILRRDYFRLISFVLFFFLLICFHRLGSVPGIFLVSIAYLFSFTVSNVKVNAFAGSVAALFAILLTWNVNQEVKPQVPPVSQKAPNILILSADSLRYDKMGYALGKRGLTPNIDSLSQDSVIFQDHHTTIPRTFPAWADLLTGQPSFVHGIQDMFPDLKDRSGLNRTSSRTLPKLLSQLGYRTEVVSSFAGDIFPRADWGFQSVKAPMFHAGTLTSQRILETQSFLLPIVTGSLPMSGPYFAALRGIPSLGEDSKILDDLWPALEKKENPFFTVFFSSVTHFPFSPQYPYYKEFTNPEYYGKFKYFKFVDPSDSSELEAPDREQIRGLFQGAIASFDESVGKIVARLKEKGLYDSTLIVLTSDHGEALFEADHSHGHGEHLRGEGVTHIPLLIKFPNNKGAGKKFTGITSSLDLFPTLVSFVSDAMGNSPVQNELRNELKNRLGRDLSVALTAETWKNSRSIYGETGIWFSDMGDHFFQRERIFYPNILRLHSIEAGEIPFITIGDSYAKESVIVSKHRMFQNANRKLIYAPSEDGVKWRCYDRIADPWNVKPLAVSECSSLKDSLVSFLLASGKFKKAGEYLLPLSN